MRHDDDVDEAELDIDRKPAMPKGEWILGVCGIGAILLFGFGLGVSLGQSRTEVKAKAPADLAQVEPTKATTPDGPAATKSEPTNAAPSTPERKPTKPEPKPAKPTHTPPTKPATPPTKPDPTAVTPVLFADKIAPIFKANCNVCHGAPSIKGGLDTRTLASIAKGGDNGTAVAANDLAKSYLWMQIESGAMPPAGKDKLTPAEIKLIKDWILSGAK